MAAFYLSPVASCDANGRVLYAGDYVPQIFSDLLQLPSGVFQYQELLFLAENALKLGLESLALDVYTYLLRQVVFRSFDDPTLRPYVDHALSGLCRLTCSSSEYVWEVSSQLYSDYHRILYPHRYA